MNLRQTAQQALEALMKSHTHPLLPDDCEEAITALRAALAEPEQNPFGDDAERYARKLHEERESCKALFTERKPQTTHWEGCEAVHPECKTEQEPVAWRYRGNLHEFDPSDWAEGPVTPLYTAPTPRKPLSEEEIVRLMVGEDRVQLLYAKPGDPYFSEFAEGAIRELVESGRAIERAHGIGDSNG